MNRNAHRITKCNHHRDTHTRSQHKSLLSQPIRLFAALGTNRIRLFARTFIYQVSTHISSTQKNTILSEQPIRIPPPPSGARITISRKRIHPSPPPITPREIVVVRRIFERRSGVQHWVAQRRRHRGVGSEMWMGVIEWRGFAVVRTESVRMRVAV